jgi:hypothetical protein
MTFKQFETTDIITGKISRVSSPLWGNGNISALQSSFYTNPYQLVASGSNINDLKNGLYYNDVYYAGEPYFSVAFGNLYGSGSSAVDVSTVKAYPSKVIYSQYKNILLSSNTTEFSFATSSASNTITSSNIYVISFSTNKFKDRLDEGHIQFSLSGSKGIFTFVDDYVVTENLSDSYNIVSGSIVDGIASPYTKGGTVSAVYDGIGTLYPKNGIIVLNADKVASIVGTNLTPDITNTGAYKLNQQKILNSITLCNNSYFYARKSEYLPSRHYFVRVKNQEFNYSNNPTYVLSPTTGKIRFTEFYTDPRTYITTIGLYNENNDLVAVAKTSQPILKKFDNEALIKVRLDF